MTATATPAETLAAAVGADRVHATNLQRYEIDGMRPACAVTPRSQDEVARALRAASEARLAVIPFGGGTMQSTGNIPARYDVALDLTALDRIVEYVPEDLTVTVEAGLRLSTLNAQLGAHGQFVPFDPPDAGGATFGGIVAANATGPSRHGYDAPRDRLIGVTVALADGRLAKAGGRVVKNVAGYDLCKLYCGSFGTLGVIVAMTFKLAPLPKADTTWSAAFPSLARAVAAGFDILERRLALRALEVLSPAASAAAGLRPAWTLLARCSGGAAAVERSVRELSGVAPSGLITEPTVWERLAAALRPKAVVLRASVLPTHLAEALDGLPETAMMTATLSHGVARIGLDADNEDSRARIERLGGTWLLERAPSDLKRTLDVWGPRPPAFDVMARLKRAYDPLGTLSPGRFVGRL